MKALREWFPVIPVLLFATVIWAYCSSTTGGPDQKFAPLSVTRLEVEPGRVSPGGQIVLRNGICNSLDRPVVANVFLAAQRHNVDPLLEGNSIIFIPNELTSIPPGCSFEDEVAGTLPADFPLGTWHLYGRITVMGEGADDVQRLDVVSGVFDVVEP